MFCTINLAWWSFLLVGCHVFCHLIKRSQVWSHHGKIWHCYRQIYLVSLSVFNPGWGFTIFSQRERINTCSGTPLLPFSKEGHDRLICREGDGLSVLTWKCIALIDYINMRYGEYCGNMLRSLRMPIKTKRPGKTLTKGACFTRTILQHISPSFQWLLYLTVVSICFIIPRILLIWLTPFLSTWQKTLVTSIAVMMTSYLLPITFLTNKIDG